MSAKPDFGPAATPTAFGGDGVLVGAVGWTGTILAIIVVSLRGYAASRQNGKWRWDFIWSALTVVFGVAAWGICFTGTLYGLGNDLSKLNPNQAFMVLKYVWQTVYVGIVAITFAKFSVVALLLQVQGPTAKKRKIALWIIAAFFCTVNVLQLVFSVFQCNPQSRLWYPYLEGKCSLGFLALRWNYLQGALGAFTDFVLAMWPISIAWNLQTTMKVKVGFCLLMAIGTLPAIASALRAVNVPDLKNSKNPTREIAQFMLWAVVEFWSIVILTSIPVLRPLFLRVFYGIKKTTTGTGSKMTAHGATGREWSRPETGVAASQVDAVAGKKGGSTVGMSILDRSKDGSEEELARYGGDLDGVYVTREYDVRQGEHAIEMAHVKTGKHGRF